MEKETRNAIERATQRVRGILEKDFAEQLQGDYDVMQDGRVDERPGPHLTGAQRALRARIVAAVEHKRAQGMTPKEAVADYLRDAAFTTLNRFVALKMLEARGLVQECVSKGVASSGFVNEFCGLASGLKLPDGSGYRLYIESVFDELSTEVKVLFDRRDPASALWPRRAAFEQMLEQINADDLKCVWGEDETIGWVYQYFNSQDERRKMREESSAPRNSRELAVRNQFFTPRYVVQFLTDNTLGRIWYEMRGTDTALAERCEYMVRKPGEEFAPRAKKDPRDLRLLDPACGSGHFLLYAFDLLLTIYEEAYADPQSPGSEATGQTLAQDYPSLKALRKAVPALILAHNLHGVDIDPRCAQIAQLALWMRAQRAFQDFRIANGDRPLIKRANIVIAEPMPGEKDLLQGFLDELKEDRLEDLIRRALDIPANRKVRATKAMAESLAELVSTVWDGMKLAGEMGTLLKIERDIARAIKKGRTEWDDSLPLFRVTHYGLCERTTEQLVKVIPGEGENFWTKAEKLVFQALADYVESASASGNARRKLFAEDAAQGFALADLTAKTFDVVLMNPPFGSVCPRSKKEFDISYPRTKNDVYGTFIERGIEILAPCGRLGAITSSTYFNLSTFADLRNMLLSDWAPRAFVDLGAGVMDDAAVSAACAIVEHASCDQRVEIPFFDIRFADHRPEHLRNAIRRQTAPDTTWVSADVLHRLPDQMFGYWLPKGVQRVFTNLDNLGKDAVATFGLHCRGGDERFYRTWWEVAAEELTPERWPAVFLGGTPQHFFRDTYYVVDWRDDARALREVASHASGGTFTGRDYYFRAGLTYIYTAQTTFSVQPMPEGSVFTAAAHGLFPAETDRLLYLAWLNSEPVRLLTKVINPNRFFQASYVRLIPVPEVSEFKSELESLLTMALKFSLEYVSGDECSRHFRGDWVSTVATAKGSPFEHSAKRAGTIASNIRQLKLRIDEIVRRAYDLSIEDIKAMSVRIGASTAQALPGLIDLVEGGVAAAAREHCSALIGAALGRWDIDTFRVSSATDWPDAFAALGEPKPLRAPTGKEGILVDDEGHPDDVVANIDLCMSRLWLDDYQNVNNEFRSLLGGDLRSWIRNEYWAYHISRYSLSQAKSPIYWQLATPSARYSIWLYIHAFSKDTFFRVQNDYVTPKLAHENRRLESLKSELGVGGTAAQGKEIAAQEALVEELHAFLEEIRRVAPLWNPSLDDGVIINFAPLWRLVPQHKAWQKELKATWDALCVGEDDWSHIAMHLWPERVVPKCATDRSLAIAHGLEEVFWFEDDDGKWKPRKTPTRPTKALIAERTSEAVKAALKSLIEAPDPAGSAKRGRKSKAA